MEIFGIETGLRTVLKNHRVIMTPELEKDLSKREMVENIYFALSLLFVIVLSVILI